eukprot:s2835_g4.t1
MAPKKVDKKSGKKGEGYGSGDGEQSPRPDPTATSSTHPIFNPLGGTTNDELVALGKAFSGLSLTEQLAVAESFETMLDTIQSRKKQIKSTKQVRVKINAEAKKSGKTSSSKPVSERFLKTKITLRINFEGQTFTIECFLSDRVGTIRQLIAMRMGLKSKQKLNFLLNGNPLPQTKKGVDANSSTFLYSINIQDGDEITVSIPDEGQGQDVEEADDNDGIPLSADIASEKDTASEEDIASEEGITPEEQDENEDQ